MFVLEFDQLNEAPEGVLVKFGTVMVSPGQTAISVIVLTEGVG